MDIEITLVGGEDFESWIRAGHRAFGEHISAEEIEIHRTGFEPERSLAAMDDGAIVGTAAAMSLELTVPGGAVAMAGVTDVGVAPTHRRRGILTQLMRRQLDDVRALGEPLAGLWASESVIYGRFGYGLATLATRVEIERPRSAFLRPVEDPGRIRLVERSEAAGLLPAVYDRARPGRPGMWSRTPKFWEGWLADPESWRDGASARWHAVHESQGVADGYALYRVKHDWAGGTPRSVLSISELIAASDAAYASLWRFCLDVDLIGRITAWPRPPDEAVRHLLADARALKMRVQDGMWLRLVDVPAALAARRYGAEGSLVIEVADGFCPWNEGRYALEGDPEGARCEPTRRNPDLALSANELGAAYLGGVRPSTLARAGRVEELRAGALRTADAMFGWDQDPWCPAVF